MPPLETGEEKIIEVRKHWIFFFIHIFPMILLAIVPGFFIVNAVLRDALFFYFLWLLLLWVGIFIVWTEYYLDVWVITNNRLIDIDQKALFVRQVSTLYLEKIEDITITSDGFLESMLGFGTILVQTAGEKEEFVMHGVSDPDGVKEVLFRYHHAIMREPFVNNHNE